MREQWLKWFVIVLSIAGVSAAVLFATDADRTDDGRSGSQQAPTESPDVNAQSLFVRRCGQCHTRDEVVSLVQRHPTSRRRAWLADLLVSHHAPETTERESLVDYLTEAARAGE